jgi:galactose oxidase-like protein/Kelch motif protein
LVLVVGGVAGNPSSAQYLSSAELYDPQTRRWRLTGSLQTARADHSATLLADGRVLIAGGRGASTSVELYDPATGTFTNTGSLSVPRFGHSATLLPSGQVLVAGGQIAFGSPTGLTDAEVYTPDKGTWQPVGSLSLGRHNHTATPLRDGRVLIAGGNVYDDDATKSVELFDLASHVFTVTTSLAVERFDHGAVLLTSGQVLVVAGTAGGGSPHFAPLNSTEVYSPTTDQWTSVGSLTTPRFGGFTLTAYPDGTVFVAGGYGYRTSSFAVFASVEAYRPTTQQWETVTPLQVPRYNHTATLIPDGSILMVGGYAQYGGNTPLRSVERYLFVYRQYIPTLLAP